MMRYLIKKTPITESNSDSEPFIDSDSDEETEEEKQIYSVRPNIWKNKPTKAQLRENAKKKAYLDELRLEEQKAEETLQIFKIIRNIVTSNDMNKFITEYHKNPQNFDNIMLYKYLIEHAKKEFLDFLLKTQPYFWDDEIKFQYPYYSYHGSYYGDIISYASLFNNVEFFEWLHKKKGMKDLKSDIYKLPSEKGNFDIFNYLMNLKYEYPEDIMVNVCESKNLSFIEKIHKTFKIKLHKKCLKESLDKYEIFKYLIDNNCPYDLETSHYIYIDKATSHLNQYQVKLSRKYFEDFIKRNNDLDPKLKSKIEKDIGISNGLSILFDNDDGFDPCTIC